MADTPTLPNKLTHCPMCDAKLPVELSSLWWLHMCICGIDVGGKGPIQCVCGTVFQLREGSFADESRLFADHLKTVEHGWKKLAVRRTMEEM